MPTGNVPRAAQQIHPPCSRHCTSLCWSAEASCPVEGEVWEIHQANCSFWGFLVLAEISPAN